MTRPITCVNHPLKPARCLCNECDAGLCKYCYIETGEEGNKKYWCSEHAPEKSNRGVAKIQL
jgi:hypothetical protein